MKFVIFLLVIYTIFCYIWNLPEKGVKAKFIADNASGVEEYDLVKLENWSQYIAPYQIPAAATVIAIIVNWL